MKGRTLALALAVMANSAWAKEPPRLVLQITVDQLRGDLPYRYLERMGEGGFRYLLDEGVVFHDAHHWHANTETVVGHATLATGAHPATHGMIGNVWLDRYSGGLVYNVEDLRYRLLTTGAAVDDADEIDPTQRAANTSGRSPANLRVSTLSDEIRVRHGRKSKIFAVSVKDRGAIPMAGQSGQAYWFSKKTGEFVTSNFYRQEYPDWVALWNANDKADEYHQKTWDLLQPAQEYANAHQDDAPWETFFPGFGRTFPHAYGDKSDRYFYTLLTLSPAGDALTLDFAKTLISEERIGQDGVTDFLSVSFSSTDYVGHIFGPSSLEMEDNLLRLDRTLANLLAYVDKKVGLKRTLVVLSADHGSAEAVGYLRSLALRGRHVDPQKWDADAGIKALKEKLGVGREVVVKFYPPYVYLSREVLERHDIELEYAQEVVAEVLRTFPGVANAIPSFQLLDGDIKEQRVHQLVANNHDSRRSGDVYLVLEPQSFINDFDGLVVASHHGSPWRYDTFVPLIFAGYGLKDKDVYRPVKTIDVAPTIARILRITAPSGAEGEVLTEVLNQLD